MQIVEDVILFLDQVVFLLDVVLDMDFYFVL